MTGRRSVFAQVGPAVGSSIPCPSPDLGGLDGIQFPKWLAGATDRAAWPWFFCSIIFWTQAADLHYEELSPWVSGARLDTQHPLQMVQRQLLPPSSPNSPCWLTRLCVYLVVSIIYIILYYIYYIYNLVVSILLYIFTKYIYFYIYLALDRQLSWL